MGFNNFYGGYGNYMPPVGGGFNGAIQDVLNQYKAYQQPYQLQQAPTNNGLIFVDGEEQAKNYLVTPNNAVPLLERNMSFLYIKSADGAGMPTFKKYKIIDVDNEETPTSFTEKHVCKCGENFVSTQAFTSLQEEFAALRDEVDELKAKPKAKIAKKTEAENE